MIIEKDIPRYNLGYVMRETGIRADTLRAWERRYGVPAPQRSDGGHRLYSQHDIETIQWLIRQQNEGLSISKAVKLLKDLIAEGRDPLSPANARPGATAFHKSDPASLRAEWIRAIRDFDTLHSDQLLSQVFDNLPLRTALEEVLHKGMIEIGELWYRGQVTVQQEHFASALAIQRLNSLIAAAAAPIQPARILVALPAGEEHEIGSLMLTLMLRYGGFDVVYLGANVPIAQFQETLQQTKPKLVILSAQHLPSAASLRETASFINQHDIALAFGGQIFNRIPELRERIPGTFIGETLEQALAFVTTLMTSSPISPSAQAIPEVYTNLHDLYQSSLPQIELKLQQKIQSASLPPGALQIYNGYLAKTISAALCLGDIQFASDDVDWVKDLIGHHDYNSEILPVYLHAYQDALNEAVGNEGELISAWLQAEISRFHP